VSRPDPAIRAVTTVAALAAAFVAQKAVAAGWTFVTGSNPRDEDDDDQPLLEVLVFAAVSAGAIAVAKTWAARRAAAYVQQGTTNT
jgi:siroheme synthase